MPTAPTDVGNPYARALLVSPIQFTDEHEIQSVNLN